MNNADGGCPLDVAALPMRHDRASGWRGFRDAGPVVQVGDQWFLTTREAADAALRHPELFSSAKAFDSLGSPLPLVPIAMDPPAHKRYRKVLDPFFAPRRIAELQPELRRQAGELIDGLVDQGRCDIVTDLATPYPSQVFLTLFGLPLSDRERLLHWKDAVIKASTSAFGEPLASEDELAAAAELYQYLCDTIAHRQANVDAGATDVLSRLIAASDEESRFSTEELLGLGFLLVLAGLDTVTAAIGFAFERLAKNPDLRGALFTDPAHLTAFIEEVVRLDPPAPMVPRVTTEDVEVCGTRIPAGASVTVVLASANRDPDAPDCPATPDDVDLAFAGRRHLGFGGGIHRCLGSHLGRAELRLVLEEFHRRIPDYELEPGFTPSMPWPANTIAIDRVPLVWSTAGER